MNKHPHLDKIIADALALESPRVAVCCPCSASSIEAAVSAQQMGLIRAIMIGPRKRIAAIAAKSALDLTAVEFVETGDDPFAAAPGGCGFSGHTGGFGNHRCDRTLLQLELAGWCCSASCCSSSAAGRRPLSNEFRMGRQTWLGCRASH